MGNSEMSNDFTLEKSLMILIVMAAIVAAIFWAIIAHNSAAKKRANNKPAPYKAPYPVTPPRNNKSVPYKAPYPATNPQGYEPKIDNTIKTVPGPNGYAEPPSRVAPPTGYDRNRRDEMGRLVNTLSQIKPQNEYAQPSWREPLSVGEVNVGDRQSGRFETDKAIKRIRDLVQEIGIDFLGKDDVFRAAMNDTLFDMKLERTALINAMSVHIGKILLAANVSSGEEKRKAVLRARDKLINDAAFSDEGADFVVTVLATALGW
jgi:hypothetical protein